MNDILLFITSFIFLCFITLVFAIVKRWKALKIAKTLTEFDAGDEIYNYFYNPPVTKIKKKKLKNFFAGVYIYSVFLAGFISLVLDANFYIFIIIALLFCYIRYREMKKRVGIGKIIPIKDNPLFIFEETCFKIHRSALSDAQNDNLFETISYPEYLIVRTEDNLYHLSFLAKPEGVELSLNLFFTEDQFEIIAKKLRKKNNCTVLIYGLTSNRDESRRKRTFFWSIFSAIPAQNMNVYKKTLPYEGFV